jgi:hypothetical protein
LSAGSRNVRRCIWGRPLFSNFDGMDVCHHFTKNPTFDLLDYSILLLFNFGEEAITGIYKFLC